MGDSPDSITNISLILSHVMDDICVNKKGVMMRRRMYMSRENVESLHSKMAGNDITFYIFGSQTEGTTSEGLNSDTDMVCVYEDLNVIQDWTAWKYGKLNLMMLQDERHPGHCKLQALRIDAPLPMLEIPYPVINKFVYDSNGVVLINGFKSYFGKLERFGPAERLKVCHEEIDLVPAFRCKTWPNNYKQWIPNSNRRDWQTPEMVEYMMTTDCLLVAIPDPFDKRNSIWRISTSFAERCLMFSLNITQIRCYILLKMIVKTFIEPTLPGTISSYMCKTLLFNCIENTRKEFWREQNLLRCVQNVILYMVHAVFDENCANYFNTSVNFFIRKINSRNKETLLSAFQKLLKSSWRFLLNIGFDNINRRLIAYGVDRNDVVSREERGIVRFRQYRVILYRFLKQLCSILKNMSTSQQCDSRVISPSYANYLVEDFIKFGILQREATRIFLPFIYSFVASMTASKSIIQNTEPTSLTLKLFDLSLDSDVTSSRLKFASYLYCTGQLERTLSVLEDAEERMTDSVMMMCGCHEPIDIRYPPGFGKEDVKQKYPTTKNLAMCVMFSNAEMPCCPLELRYELFRSMEDEKRERNNGRRWMDLVVMDALPFLYFLKYMTHRSRGRHDLQYTALNKLTDIVNRIAYFAHRETACNVLGQCMEYEGWLDKAWMCYEMSLELRPTNNAVRWHIMRILRRMRLSSNL